MQQFETARDAHVSDVREHVKKQIVVMVRTLSYDIDGGAIVESADAFAEITVGGHTFVEVMQRDEDEVMPMWTVFHFVDPETLNGGVVNVTYVLKDENTLADDTVLDINPDSEEMALRFSIDIVSLNLEGDVNGVHDTEDTAFEIEGDDEKVKAKVKVFVKTFSLEGCETVIPTSLDKCEPEISRFITDQCGSSSLTEFSFLLNWL